MSLVRLVSDVSIGRGSFSTHNIQTGNHGSISQQFWPLEFAAKTGKGMVGVLVAYFHVHFEQHIGDKVIHVSVLLQVLGLQANRWYPNLKITRPLNRGVGPSILAG